MPRNGLDIYGCCCPCAPWSSKGGQLGLQDERSGLFFQAVDSIKYMQPCFYWMENVLNLLGMSTSTEGPRASAPSNAKHDIGVINEYMKKQLPDYTTILIKTLCPRQVGYATKKTRLIILGARGDIETASGSVMQAYVQRILDATSNLLQHNYRQLVGLNSLPALQMERVGELAMGEEVLSPFNCGCKLDPRIVCAIHKCTCKKCREDGVEAASCIWRKTHMNFIAENLPDGILEDARENDKLTYCLAIEMQGMTAPRCPRERSIVNIMARLPRVLPLARTFAVMDVSQSIDRCSLRVDGATPTIGGQARLFSLRDGRVLSTSQIAKIMGRELFDLKGSVTACQYKAMLGQSFHPACMGVVLLAILASSVATD